MPIYFRHRTLKIAFCFPISLPVKRVRDPDIQREAVGVLEFYSDDSSLIGSACESSQLPQVAHGYGPQHEA
jgi:hypothetical protein